MKSIDELKNMTGLALLRKADEAHPAAVAVDEVLSRIQNFEERLLKDSTKTDTAKQLLKAKNRARELQGLLKMMDSYTRQAQDIQRELHGKVEKRLTPTAPYEIAILPSVLSAMQGLNWTEQLDLARSDFSYLRAIDSPAGRILTKQHQQPARREAVQQLAMEMALSDEERSELSRAGKVQEALGVLAQPLVSGQAEAAKEAQRLGQQVVDLPADGGAAAA